MLRKKKPWLQHATHLKYWVLEGSIAVAVSFQRASSVRHTEKDAAGVAVGSLQHKMEE